MLWGALLDERMVVQVAVTLGSRRNHDHNLLSHLRTYFTVSYETPQPGGTGKPSYIPGQFFFLDFPIYLQSVEIHSNTISKWCIGKQGRVEECSVAPLRDKRVKTLCGCREKRVQTKEKYKLRLKTKAYILSYNYINYTINLVGRSFGKWHRSRLRSGCSRRVRRMSPFCRLLRLAGLPCNKLFSQLQSLGTDRRKTLVLCYFIVARVIDAAIV
jgi:hypothetical protein